MSVTMLFTLIQLSDNLKLTYQDITFQTSARRLEVCSTIYTTRITQLRFPRPANFENCTLLFIARNHFSKIIDIRGLHIAKFCILDLLIIQKRFRKWADIFALISGKPWIVQTDSAQRLPLIFKYQLFNTRSSRI